MLKFLPSDAILKDSNGSATKFYTSGDWFMAYEWLCRKLMESKPNDVPYHLLDATSGIGHTRFSDIWSVDAACKRIAYLFKRGWYHSEADPFLSHLNINHWADLATPIFIKGRRPTIFPQASWFKMQGRVFSYSPNSCHPKAKWVSGFCLRFSAYRKRWEAGLNYDCPHGGGSTWMVTLEQNYREHLDTFAKRIEVWLGEQLIPESRNEAMSRQERLETWNRAYSAMKDLFWDGYTICNAENQMADELVKIRGASLVEGRMKLDKQRFATLKRWAKSSKERK